MRRNANPEPPTTVRGGPALVALVFVLATAVLFLFELAKQLIHPHIQVWESHAVTTVFGALLAVLASYMIQRRYERICAVNALINQQLHQARAQLESQVEDLKELTYAMEQSPSCVVITDTEGNMEYVNPKFTQLTGYSLEEVLGQNPRILKTGDTSPEEYKRLWETIESGGEWHGEFHNKKKNGELYWESASISSVKDTNGAITHYLGIKQDITERKAMEEELRWKTAFLEAQVESSLDGILVVDQDGRRILSNQQFFRVWDLPIELAAEWDDAIILPQATIRAAHPVRFAERVAYLYAHRDEESRDEIELADGRTLERYSAPVLGKEDGRYYGRIWFFRDITQRKRAEQTLQESEEKYRELFQNAGDGILLHKLTAEDIPDRFIEVNDTACEMLGYERSELIGMAPWDIDDAEYSAKTPGHERALEDRGRVLREKGHTTFETVLRKKSGHPLPVEIRSHAFELAGSWVLLSVVRDITERKKAEEALAREASVIEAVADLKSSLLFSASIEVISVLVLGNGQQLTGSETGFVGYIAPETGYLVPTTMSAGTWGQRQVEGKDVDLGTFSRLWGWVLNNKKPLLTNTPSQDERSTVTPPGHIPISRFVSAPAILGDELVGVVALANSRRDYEQWDLSTVQRLADFYALAIQRTRAEETVAKRSADLARSNADLQQFAYVASHDLQEPLRMVTSYVQLLARRYQGKLDSDADEFIAFAVDGTHRMQALISGLLDFSRVGTRGKAFEPTDCEAVLQAVVGNLKVAIEESGGTVTHSPLPTISADAEQLTRLLQNLIGNAIKFHGDAPPCVDLSADKSDEEWTFSVRDNGIGIAPEHRDRVFQIFERLHTEREYPGTGMGLAICRRIVERHGGRIWVESDVGEGSTFRFTIPAVRHEQ